MPHLRLARAAGQPHLLNGLRERLWWGVVVSGLHLALTGGHAALAGSTLPLHGGQGDGRARVRAARALQAAAHERHDGRGQPERARDARAAGRVHLYDHLRQGAGRDRTLTSRSPSRPPSPLTLSPHPSRSSQTHPTLKSVLTPTLSRPRSRTSRRSKSASPL